MMLALLFLTLPALGATVGNVTNCIRANTPGAICLDPNAGSPGCWHQSCWTGSSCQETIALSNWTASAVQRECSQCLGSTASTSANGVDLRCHIPTTGYITLSSLVGKGPLKCYSCSGSPTSACALLHFPSSLEAGGWTEPVAYTGCWTKVTYVSGTATNVERGFINANTPAPPHNYDTTTGNGNITVQCQSRYLCNDAALLASYYRIGNAPANPTTATAAPTGPSKPPAADASSIACVPLPVILLSAVLLKIIY